MVKSTFVMHPFTTSQLAPPKVMNINYITGAGDYFLACHIANEINQLGKEKALLKAAESASKYVETEIL